MAVGTFDIEPSKEGMDPFDSILVLAIRFLSWLGFKDSMPLRFEWFELLCWDDPP